MERVSQEYPISPNLLELTEHQVALLDQEATNGEGWDYYCNGYISKATVFLNKISGLVRDFGEEFYVEIKVNGQQLSSFCSCKQNGYLCKHVIALLYSWVNDGDGFKNLGDSLKRLQDMDKEELIAIIKRIVLYDPRNIDFFEARDYLEDEDDMEGLFN